MRYSSIRKRVNWNSNIVTSIIAVFITLSLLTVPVHGEPGGGNVHLDAAQCTFYTKRSTVYLLVTGNAKLMRNGRFVQYVSTGKYTIGPVKPGVTWRCA